MKRSAAERYERDLNKMTTQLDSLSNTINTLTKLTLKLDKSFKENILSEKELASNPQAVDTNSGASIPNEKLKNINPASYSADANLLESNNNDNLVITNEWRIKQQESQLVSSFDAHFTNQNTDSIWANSAEQAIQNALNSDVFINSQLMSISCRATLCKIDTDHRDLDSELVFLQQINSKAGFSDTESFYTRNEQPGGNIVMTLYLSRDGHRLPRFALAAGNIAG